MLVVSAMCACWDDVWAPCLDRLVECFGPTVYCPEPSPMVWTHYYDDELGQGVGRRILAFEGLVPQDHLLQAKLALNDLERASVRVDGRRRINLDPGVLTLERFVLASGKNNAHRIYLGRKIFADLALLYQRGAWNALPWTYPDYASTEMAAKLKELRGVLKTMLQQGTQGFSSGSEA
jgi:hypothetical protein